MVCTDLASSCADASNCNELALDPTTGIVYYNFSEPIAGIQFNIDGGTAASAAGGAAQTAGWILQVAGSTVLGFSFSNTEVPAGSGVLFTITGDVASATGLSSVVTTTAGSEDVASSTTSDVCNTP